MARPSSTALALLGTLLLVLSLHPATTDAYTDPFICLVNAARIANGVQPVGWSKNLQQVAKKMAVDMEGTGVVSHFGSDGSNPLTRLAGLGLEQVGENVAGGQTTAKWAMESFMGSPGHRETLLTPSFNCFGSARASNFWAQEFGQSANGCPVPDCSRFASRRLLARALQGVEIDESYRASVADFVYEGDGEAVTSTQDGGKVETGSGSVSKVRAAANSDQTSTTYSTGTSDNGKKISSTFLPSPFAESQKQ